ncbi:MAG: phage protein Gp37 [Gemmatimonadota bacterium]|nr:phage protein Gp37 [Gemmatimonadota bacterium]
MAAAVKTISDAIIARLASDVESLNTGTVATFAGSIEEFVSQGLNLPFAGVALENISYQQLNTDSSLAEEHLTFRLTVVAEDFRGRRYSVENTYSLVDSIRDALMGQTLGISGLAPVTILKVEKDSQAEEFGLAVYSLQVQTWQVRQQS